MDKLDSIVGRALGHDLDAWRLLVQGTQAMAYAVALRVLDDRDLAQDAAQEAYLRAFRNLAALQEPAAFVNWLRRIVITVATDLRKARRTTLLQLDVVPVVPVLDEAESSWSEAQRRLLAEALLTLTVQERRLCDRRYHGGWSVARLATDAGVDEAAMRKRLQRLRDKLRREMEMSEQRDLRPEDLGGNLPARIVDLLTRPNLTVLPDNPVGRVLEMIRSVYPDFTEVDPPEILNLTQAREKLGELPYAGQPDLCRIDDDRILRSDLSLPLLMTLRFEDQPLRVWAAGKAYRAGQIDATHLEAFHQAEFFWLDDRERFDPWSVAGRVHRSLDVLLPGTRMQIAVTHFPMCTHSWELEVEHNGRWMEVAAWGIYTDDIVRDIGGDPVRHTAAGVAYGLERLAMLRFDVDDIRKVDVARLP